MNSYGLSLQQQRPGLYYPASHHNRSSAPLYAGKWTLEEERYVTYLSEQFKDGALDVPEGKSLRCFLADQSNCNAKRISKKYERTGYNGKLQYVDKRASFSPEELSQRRQERKELERKFRESRETLKIVEASRKRNDGLSLSPVEPAAKRAKTALLTSVAPRLMTGSLDLSTSLGVRAMGLGIFGGSPAAASNAMMESLLLRRSLLARQNSQAQSNDLIRASMLSALQKYGTTRAGDTPRPIAAAWDPSVVGLLAMKKSTGAGTGRN